MPGGDAWQFLGKALGANPTPMAYAEVYTGLQTGAIDGQDNPLPNVQNMKFYEVMSQIVLTSHLVGYDLWTISLTAWNAMSPEQQTLVQSASDEVIAWSTEQHLAQEASSRRAVPKRPGSTFTSLTSPPSAPPLSRLTLPPTSPKTGPQAMVDQINAL